MVSLGAVNSNPFVSLYVEENGCHSDTFRLPLPDRSPIYEWARKHVQLPESYATPGPFNVRLSPWLIAGR